MLQAIPEHWGRQLETEHGAVSHSRVGPNAIRLQAQGHLALILLSTQTARHVALNSDRMMAGAAPVGSIELVPMGSDLSAQWETPKENVLAGLTAP